MWCHTFTVFRNARSRLDLSDQEKCSVLKTQTLAPFDPNCWYNVRKMNKDKLPHVFSGVFFVIVTFSGVSVSRICHQKHTISYLYSFFLHYINNWNQKVQNSVFYEAFVPITWIKSSAFVKKYSPMYGVTSCHAYVTSRCLRSSDAGWLACGLAKEKRITWLSHQGNAFFAFLNLLAWLYALLSALRIKIFKILWCSNKRVIRFFEIFRPGNQLKPVSWKSW